MKCVVGPTDAVNLENNRTQFPEKYPASSEKLQFFVGGTFLTDPVYIRKDTRPGHSCCETLIGTRV